MQPALRGACYARFKRVHCWRRSRLAGSIGRLHGISLSCCIQLLASAALLNAVLFSTCPPVSSWVKVCTGAARLRCTRSRSRCQQFAEFTAASKGCIMPSACQDGAATGAWGFNLRGPRGELQHHQTFTLPQHYITYWGQALTVALAPAVRHTPARHTIARHRRPSGAASFR